MSNDQPGPELQPTSKLLERDVSLSRSIIWRLQRDFYSLRGMKAWTEDLIPSYITSNPLIAEMYAEIVAAFFTDCAAHSTALYPPRSAENPLRILELGAGTGKFAGLFLRKLRALLRELGLPLDSVRYTMTDCSEQVIAGWRTNRYLAEFATAGILHFELLCIDQNGIAGHTAGTAHPGGPLVVIANYVFDSLPQDAFALEDGNISEILVSVGTSGNSIGPQALSYSNVPVAPQRYADPLWNRILEQYRLKLPSATVLFPTSALHVLQQLQDSSDGRMLVLAADKGFAYEDELPLARGAPPLEFHSGNCFSQIVNFHAIATYFTERGGAALLPEKHFSPLSICAFLQLPKEAHFAATNAAFCQAQAGVGPDDVFTLLGWLHPHMEEMSVAQILAMLRLSRWDPVALMRVFPVLGKQLGSVNAERNDLRQAVMRIWENNFPVNSSENALAFQCGVILLELRLFADALAMFQESERMLGRSAPTSYNLGLCELGLGRSAAALEYMSQALEQDPGFEPARTSRQNLTYGQDRTISKQ